MVGKKSRHYKDDSDPLLDFYSNQIAATSSIRTYQNPILCSSDRHPFDSIRSVRANLTPTKKIFRHSDSKDNQQNGNSSSSLSGLALMGGGDEDSPPLIEKKNRTKKKRVEKKDRYKIHRVSYTAQNHIQVLFQMYGSAFPQVFPFCLINFLWTLLVVMLKKKQIVDLTFHSSIGHSFMGLLVSFLIVSRSKISYDRFMEFRRLLATSYRTCREIAQFTTVYTFQTQTAKAKAWRSEVCYRTILLLRLTMDALLWSSTERDQWEDEYFQYDTHKDAKSDLDDVSEHFFRFRALSHGRRSNIDENFRAPISFSHVLRQTIMEHPEYLGYKMAVNEYRDLLDFVTKFNEAFHGFRVLVFTPYPFPLVQMTRTFLFFWVYSLPLVLLKEYRVWSSLLIVTLTTFGFVGVEYVSMALDDPFGDDTNDVDEHGMALLVYEDMYLAIYRTDGPKAAWKLRERILASYKQGRGLDCYREDLKGYKFWEPMRYPIKSHEEENDNASNV